MYEINYTDTEVIKNILSNYWYIERLSEQGNELARAIALDFKLKINDLGLNTKERRLINLHTKGYTQEEIAEDIGYSQGYIAKLLNQMIERLVES